jgi:hypothetical protein
MDIVFAVLGFLGPLGLVGLWIFIMINKQGWKIVQIIAGGIFALLLVSSFPQLPQAVHDGVVSVTKALSNSK